MLSASFGLPSLVGFTLARGVSEYYLGGCRKHWTPTVQLLTCFAAVTSWLGVRAHALVVKDDRLSRVLGKLESTIEAGVFKIAVLPDTVVACLANIIGHDNHVILGNIMNFIGFMEHDVS